MSDLLRMETAISWLDLRLDVGSSLQRVARTEDVHLTGDRIFKSHGDIIQLRGSQDITVGGKYTRDTGNSKNSDVFAVEHSQIREEVFSNVVLMAKFESEAIMGGGYASQNVGPYARLCFMYDVMCMWLWTEIDVVRMEIVQNASIKGYLAYAHNVVVRNAMAYFYMDDFQNRTETFSTLNDNQTLLQRQGGPGSGVEMND